MMDENGSFPWDRQPGESHRWYQRFTLFRLEGPGRSLLELVKAEKALKSPIKPLKTVPGAWKNAAKAWHWIERAEAWDLHMAAEMDAKWLAQHMGAIEAIGRLSEMGRANPYPFFEKKTVTKHDELGNPYEVEVYDFNWDTVREYGHLIKKLGWDRNGNPSLELQDRIQAIKLVGQNQGLFREQMDVTSGGKPLAARSLSDEELAAIAAGSGGGAAE
jgi:hypothetical protein